MSDTVEAFERISGLVEQVSVILSRFADMRSDDLDSAVNFALGSIGQHVGVDRSYVFTIGDDDNFIDNTHEWCAEGVTPEIENLQGLPSETIHFWWPRLRAGKEIYIPCVADIPKDRSDERELLDEQGIQSLLVVPLLAEGELLGFIGFDSVATMRDWSPIERQLLMAAADIIAGGMVRSEMYQELSAKERRFSRLLRYSADLTLIVGSDQVVKYASDAAERVTGWLPEELVGKRLRDVLTPESYPVLDGLSHRTIEEEGADLPDLCALTRSGTRRWLSGHICDVRDDANIHGFIINLHDISTRKKAEEALQFQALHDPLTGLANRALLAERLEMLSDNEYLKERPVGLLFLDLDHFKSVNDSLGHDVGDLLLVDVADRLRRAVAEIDLIARFGGDEFVVLLEAGLDRSRMLQAAAAVMDVFEVPFTVDGEERLVSASAGLVISDRGHEAAVLVRDADAAMYQAKLRGRSRLEQFDMTLQQQLRGVMQLSHDLKDVTRRNELLLDFQPFWDSSTRKIAGVEALLRWNHPARGLLLPEHFLHLAEESKSIIDLGDWVLSAVARQVKQWEEQVPLPKDFTAAVNLSARQLADAEFPDRALAIVNRAGVSAASVVFDVREAAILTENDVAISALTKLAANGFKLALDDFGASWSSMECLRDLPITTLKLAGEFTLMLERGERDRKIVIAMLMLADQLGLKTLAKSVESAQQAEDMSALSCHYLQGNVMAKAQGADVIESLLAADSLCST